MTAIVPDATPARSQPAWLVPALVTLTATVVAWWASVLYVVGVFHDDGIYALLGKAIAPREPDGVPGAAAFKVER